MSIGISDSPQRARALDPGTSFIVQAPAGSGKTELLIQRFLVLLARVERPEEIAAITFTRKAAGEMKRRIVEALAAARSEPRPPQEHKAATWDLARAVLDRDAALGWNLEESAGRLRIQTIDALCASLTRQMPVLSRFGAQPESVDDASALYAEAARNTLTAVQDEKDPAAGDVARLLAHLDNNAGLAESLLAALLCHRDHWLRSLRSADDRSGFETTLATLRLAALQRAKDVFPALPDLAPLPEVENVEGWQSLADELLTKKGEWRKNSFGNALAGNDALLKALCAVQALPPSRYDEAQWEALGVIARLLPRAVGELKLVFAAHGQADFVEIAQAALRALHAEDGPTDLLLALDYRIRHLLVDEFQDTSFTQSALLEHLTSGWQPGDARTLFVVGDPMQSIYRFREAEVALFLKAQQRGIGSVPLEPITLTANFRSQAGIVEWVNRTFAGVMPRVQDVAAGAVRYSPSDAIHPAAPDAVTVHPLFDGDAAGEAARVAQIARKVLEEPPDGKPSTVAILVRNRKHLSEIVPRLKAAGLAFRAIEIEPLGHRPVVQDLLALTRAVAHVADRVAWLAVLRAPWAGLTLADLEALAGREDLRTIWELIGDPRLRDSLSADGRARLERTAGVMAHALARRARSSLRDTVEGAWLALGGPACVESATDLEDADVYLDHLEASEVAGTLPSLADFEQGLAKLFALPDVDASERLQVMTIHKSKGLEFDTVIVPGLGAGTGRDDRKLFMWMETTDGLLLAPINPAGSDADPIYEFIRRLDKDKGDHECGRLLYVVATRAKRQLHLFGDCKRDSAGGIREPSKGSLLAKLWPAVQRDFTDAALPGVMGESRQRATPRSDELVRLASPVVVSRPPSVAWDPPPDPGRFRDTIEFSWAGETARHVGSVVHRWLQRIADDEMRGWDARRIAAARPSIVNELASWGVAPAQVEEAATRVIAALAGSVEDARGRWLLGPQRGARNEYRLTAMVAGQRRHLVIDRMFVDAEGRSWIVDYKSSSHEGADTEGFLAEQQKRYREQLEQYASVALASQGAMLGLYFPLLKAWREWAAAQPNAQGFALTK